MFIDDDVFRDLTVYDMTIQRVPESIGFDIERCIKALSASSRTLSEVDDLPCTA